MAIIINEFEIVNPPDGGADGGSSRSPSQGSRGETTAPSASMQPADIEEIMRRALQRRLRVWAD